MLKRKGAHEPKAQTAGVHPGFLSMKHAKSIATPPLDRMLVHRTVTPSSMSPVPIYSIRLGKERQSGVKFLA